MPRTPKILSHRLVPGIVLVLAALSLYLLTLDDGLRPDELMGGDLITHQYAQAQGRFANAPGYPLYTMLGWLWFHLGRRILAWAFNPVQILSLYSTLWAVAALLVLYLLLIELLPHRRWLALWGTAYYAVTYFFWYYAVTTEQYTSAVFQTLLLVWLAFRWRKKAPESREEAKSLLLWMAFVVGTCAANLITTLLIVPPLLAFVFIVDPKLRGERRLALKAAALAALPVLSYAYVYIRGAQHPEWRGQGSWPSTLAWFLEFLTAPQGRSEMSWTLWPPSENYPWLALRELSWPVFVAGLLGWALLDRPGRVLFYGTAALYFAFCYVDRFGNWYQVIMPLYPLLIVGATLAMDGLLRRGRPSRWRELSAAAGLIALLAWRFVSNYPIADQSGRADATGLEPGWAILADAPPEGSCIAGTYEQNLALQYLTEIWGARPRVRPVSVDEAVAMALEGHPCFITRQAVAVAPALHELGLHPNGAGATLISLQRRPAGSVPEQVCTNRGCAAVQRADASLAELRLLGYAALESSEVWKVTLFWQAVERPTRDYVVSVRLTHRGGLLRCGEHTVQQDHPPVWGAYPTSAWEPGEVVRDDYILALLPPCEGSSPEPDGIQVLVYYFAGEGEFVNAGGPVHLPLPGASAPNPQSKGGGGEPYAGG